MTSGVRATCLPWYGNTGPMEPWHMRTTTGFATLFRVSLLWASCDGEISGTSAGTNTLTAMATSGKGTTRTVDLTLVVN